MPGICKAGLTPTCEGADSRTLENHDGKTPPPWLPSARRRGIRERGAATAPVGGMVSPQHGLGGGGGPPMGETNCRWRSDRSPKTPTWEGSARPPFPSRSLRPTAKESLTAACGARGPGRRHASADRSPGQVSAQLMCSLCCSRACWGPRTFRAGKCAPAPAAEAWIPLRSSGHSTVQIGRCETRPLLPQAMWTLPHGGWGGVAWAGRWAARGQRGLPSSAATRL